MAPTGSVTFRDGATTLGTGTLSAGVATFAISSLCVGTHPVTAVYDGDSSRNGSSSAVLNQIVNAVPLVPTLSISDMTLPEGDSGAKNFVFTVTLLPASTKIVTVKIRDGQRLGHGGQRLHGDGGQADFRARTNPVKP